MYSICVCVHVYVYIYIYIYIYVYRGPSSGTGRSWLAPTGSGPISSCVIMLYYSIVYAIRLYHIICITLYYVCSYMYVNYSTDRNVEQPAGQDREDASPRRYIMVIIIISSSSSSSSSGSSGNSSSSSSMRNYIYIYIERERQTYNV